MNHTLLHQLLVLSVPVYLSLHVCMHPYTLLCPHADVQSPPFLYGSTNFGENVEDEWLVVFVCVELTRRVQGLVVK